MPMVPTRYGSSAMHSSTRPQRGSRIDVEHRREALVDAERAHRVADRRAHLARRARGRRPRPRRAGSGRWPPSRPASPVRHSSCTIAGMPSRVPVTRSRWNSHSHAGPLDRVDRAGAVGAGEVAEPVAARTRRGRRPRRTRPAAARRPRRRPSPRSRRSGRASPPGSSGRAGRARACDAAVRSGAHGLRQGVGIAVTVRVLERLGWWTAAWSAGVVIPSPRPAGR